MKRFKLHLLFIWMMSCVLAPAHAGNIYHDTRVWAIKGPGGVYGLVESQGDPVSIQGQTVYETMVCLGPLYARLPCRAPVAVVISTSVLLFVGWLIHFAVKYWRRNEAMTLTVHPKVPPSARL
jgi:hypothetical protein